MSFSSNLGVYSTFAELVGARDQSISWQLIGIVNFSSYVSELVKYLLAGFVVVPLLGLEVWLLASLHLPLALEHFEFLLLPDSVHVLPLSLFLLLLLPRFLLIHAVCLSLRMQLLFSLL